MPLYAQIKHRRDTQANWESENPRIEDGEIIVVKTDSDGSRLKIGSGENYNDSPFLDNNLSNRVDALENYVSIEEGGIKTFNNSIITSGVFSRVEYIKQGDWEIDLNKASCFVLDNMALGLAGWSFEGKIKGFPKTESEDQLGACFTLIITNGGNKNVYWGSSIKWANNEPPTLTDMGYDVLTFITMDGGTTWYGTPSIINAGREG